ncbi:MAG TPA: hypothetical protein VNH64_10545, partial [Parvularculaceae bacterium]|nr:hypothetical protein [Parvularculaceae bacterium]
MPTPICILAVLVVASTANAESDSRLDKQTLSMADVAAIMSDRLSKIPEISDVTFDGDSVLHIRLKNKDEITANLANLLMELNNDPTGREDTIEKYLSTFSTEANSNGGEADVDSLHENLVPVIRGGDYEQSVQQMIGDKESPKFFRKHIVGDYWLYLALDLPQSLSIQTAKDLSILKLSADQMLLLANKNFLRKFGDEIQISEGNGVRMVRIDGSYEASLIA